MEKRRGCGVMMPHGGALLLSFCLFPASQCTLGEKTNKQKSHSDLMLHIERLREVTLL